MAELSLRERLQPSLFDRLVDDERLLTLYEITVQRAELSRLGISPRDLSDIVCAQGLERVEAKDEAALTAESERAGARLAADAQRTAADAVALRNDAQQPEQRVASEAAALRNGEQPVPPPTLRLFFQAPNGRVGLARLKSLVLKPPKAPEGVALQSFCEIDARNVINSSVEPAEKRHINARRLRECVCRDLAVLLNSTSLETTEDLETLPDVQRSVLNYGMPGLAGRASSMVDLRQISRTVEDVIRRFEPRLVQVRVTPEVDRTAADEHEIALRIEAELWGQPVPQHLVLRTRISMESGDVDVADAGAA